MTTARADERDGEADATANDAEANEQQEQRRKLMRNGGSR